MKVWIVERRVKTEYGWSDWDRNVREAITKCQIIVQREADKDCTMEEAALEQVGPTDEELEERCDG